MSKAAAFPLKTAYLPNPATLGEAFEKVGFRCVGDCYKVVTLTLSAVIETSLTARHYSLL